MEQVGLALYKSHNAEVRHVESVDFCGQAYDVAVAQVGKQIFFVEVALVYVWIHVAVVAGFKIPDAFKGGAVGERGVVVAVCRHVVDCFSEVFAVRKA